ncbi:MAG TPA: SulP family inorganic anion transporter [Gemmataceae bacterium]|nr:SulP family inorganic anion transporter [Gemmataceae bacterium]
MWERLKYFLNPIDGRYEDLARGNWYKNVFRDFTAGLIVAMVAIPLAMGFAMASGLKPEHGIVGGAIAGLIGALFGGSKYQVYGPTAAFIPVIAGVMAVYGSTPETYRAGHAFLVLASILAGAILMLMGLFGLGKYVGWVPHSIVVGFTIGIAVTIALSQVGEVLGLQAKIGYRFFDKVRDVATHLYEWNWRAVALAALTFVVTKYLLKVSVFIPAPLIALGLCSAISTTVWAGTGLMSVRDKFGEIPSNLLVFTPPGLPGPLSGELLFDLVYFAVAIVFVSAIESLLCSRMADRLADNRGQPFNPNKELWGQGWVNTAVPLVNGFPHTGALARTATNIKLGAISPLAGIFKCVLKLVLAAFLAAFLERVPMACIGGILMYVAFNMVKAGEVRQVLGHNRFHVALMLYTAAAVIVTDFLTGVLTAIILYAVLRRFFDHPEHIPPKPGATATVEEGAVSDGPTASQYGSAEANGHRPAGMNAPVGRPTASPSGGGD